MTQKFPGLNYNVPQSTSDLSYFETVIEDEILQRTKLFEGNIFQCGEDFLNYGIVDLSDPSVLSTTDTERPFFVSANSIETTNIDVQKGIVITKSGHYIKLDTKVENLPLKSGNILSGESFVIIIRYLTKNSSTKRISRYNSVQPIRTERVSNNQTANSYVIQSVSMADWENLGLYSLAIKEDIVPLAIVTTTGESTLTLLIDMTRTIYSYIRPQFSLVDIMHRNEKGTGASTVPHNLSISDLSAGNLTFYQQMLKAGRIISKDIKINNLPGFTECTEIIPTGIILTDADGSITGKSVYGGVGAKYIKLSNFPVRIGSCYQVMSLPPSGEGEGQYDFPISIDWVQGTNIVVFGESSFNIDAIIKLKYTRAKALEPPASFELSNNVILNQPDTLSELIISGGKAFYDVPNTAISFTAGAIAKYFDILIDNQKNIYSNPIIIVSPILVDDVVSQVVTVGASFQKYGKLMVGLSKAAIGTTLGVGDTISFEFVGSDIYGNSLTESITFTSDNWEDQIIPATNEKAKQFLKSEGNFSEIDHYTVTKGGNPSSQAVFVVYVEIDPMVYLTQTQDLLLFNVFWNGSGLKNLIDKRPVFKNLTDTDKNEIVINTGSILSSILTAKNLGAAITDDEFKIIMMEDFNNPKYLDNYVAQIPRYELGLYTRIFTESSDDLLDNNLKYRSRVLHFKISDTDPTGKLFVYVFGAKNITNNSFRYRAVDSDTTAFTNSDWTTATIYQKSNEICIFLLDFASQDYKKVQFELFGEALGMSALLVR